MTVTNITNLSNHLFDYISQAIDYNDVINVNTQSGNAVIISESDYNGLLETLYLSRSNRTCEEITDGIQTPLNECVPETEVQW